jgi:hypothetical protein
MGLLRKPRKLAKDQNFASYLPHPDKELGLGIVPGSRLRFFQGLPRIYEE